MKIQKFVISIVCFALLIISVCAVENKTLPSSAYGKFLRLHVIAASDNRCDQEIKLKLRDRLMPEVEKLFSGCNTIDEALSIAEENSDYLEALAKQALASMDCQDEVKITVGKEYYDERQYGDYTFPEGEYLSVRVLLGDAQGHNWWCMLFPQLYGVGVEESDAVMESCGFDSGEISALQDDGFEIFGCRIKLKFLDFFK